MCYLLSFYAYLLSSFIIVFLLLLDLLSMCFHSLPVLFICILASTPLVLATSPTMPFPNIPFSEFSEFINSQFSSGISLATVLTLVFSLMENPEFLNQHG